MCRHDSIISVLLTWLLMCSRGLLWENTQINCLIDVQAEVNIQAKPDGTHRNTLFCDVGNVVILNCFKYEHHLNNKLSDYQHTDHKPA